MISCSSLYKNNVNFIIFVKPNNYIITLFSLLHN
ncbi:Uncharacterised protein [Klebsiella pneumoniae]|nr:hypothetical protein AI2621V1_4268 [Klebsiella pneumoniae]CAH5277760.1 hypothetical protein AI2621V1_4268 [Klebsiella pneumoniae]SWW47754.1 Uncharacterised protein [Klebsiella pneumoniae]SWW89254.1 Uncharacterised protein [Klebsiella pneumoniae]